MKTYQQVLCPVDFSESSLNAARWGMEWAALGQVPLVLVHSYGLLLQDAETAAAMYPEMLRISEESMGSFLDRLQVPQEIEVKTWSTPFAFRRCSRIGDSRNLFMERTKQRADEMDVGR